MTGAGREYMMLAISCYVCKREGAQGLQWCEKKGLNFPVPLCAKCRAPSDVRRTKKKRSK